MLEREMEAAIANCPDLFIEPGLALVRRQVVINGRRPDILFNDALARQMLVEVQSGRLDEEHVQRHFYYFFDYRAKYPSAHLRLLFIANRIVPQHKEFLDEHGYEYREYPESDFSRRVNQCAGRGLINQTSLVELAETLGVLPPAFHEILFEIEQQHMTLCYKMLLLIYMAKLANEQGRVALRSLAEKFQEFFVTRSLEGKVEENPNMPGTHRLSSRTVSMWERTIKEQPVQRITEAFVTLEGDSVKWSPRIWTQWGPVLRSEIVNAATDRLRRYYERHVPGGF